MSIGPWEIRQDDLSSAETRDLVRLHLEGMHAHSPPGSVFALDLSGLNGPQVTVWTAWRAERLAGIGALNDRGPAGAYFNPIPPQPDLARAGVPKPLLEHIVRAARARGLTRLSLETGRGAYFEPALSLYRKRGFVDGDPFADYQRSPFSQFLHLPL